MPTIVALDVSLSMSRPVQNESSSEEYQRKHLAIHGINTLLDFISANCKLEFVSLVIFSYLWEQLVGFTRDMDSIKSALAQVEEYSKTCLEPMLTGVSSIVVDEWSIVTPAQIIIVTDGSPGIGPGSLKHLVETWSQLKGDNSDDKCPLPFPFKGKLHFVVLANQNDPELKQSLPLYYKLIELNKNGGEVFVPDGQLTMDSIQQVAERFADKFYSPYTGLLKCGNLRCNISLFPPPETYEKEEEFERVVKSVGSVLDICGFLDLQDIASPPTVSRHLVLPVNKDKQVEEMKDSERTDDEEAMDDGKVPSFTVLLHGSLKVEGMVALARVAEDWYGILYSWADSKKKSSLMLSLFEPGTQSISWLGDINNLAPISDFSESPYGEDDNQTPFPVRPMEKRSYAQSCVVWIKQVGLQSDLQKVIRHARKLPDKQQQFYKELNRVRKAAISLGFIELLTALSAMLERECTMLPGTAHPDAAMQLTHAASRLVSEIAADPTQNILPLRTNFSQPEES